MVIRKFSWFPVAPLPVTLLLSSGLYEGIPGSVSTPSEGVKEGPYSCVFTEAAWLSTLGWFPDSLDVDSL